MVNDLEKIEELKEKLISLGYGKYQLRAIIEDSIGRSDLKNIDSKEKEYLIRTLEDYIEFATNCKSSTINKKG